MRLTEYFGNALSQKASLFIQVILSSSSDNYAGIADTKYCAKAARLKWVNLGFIPKHPEIIPMPLSNHKEVENMVAVAAYCHGFVAGNEFDDWLETERETLAHFDELNAI